MADYKEIKKFMVENSVTDKRETVKGDDITDNVKGSDRK